MSPSERARMAVLDGALGRRQMAHARTDERTLDELDRAGFRFKTVAEAIAFQRAEREAVRTTAAQIVRRSEYTRRSA